MTMVCPGESALTSPFGSRLTTPWPGELQVTETGWPSTPERIPNRCAVSCCCPEGNSVISGGRISRRNGPGSTIVACPDAAGHAHKAARRARMTLFIRQDPLKFGPGLQIVRCRSWPCPIRKIFRRSLERDRVARGADLHLAEIDSRTPGRMHAVIGVLEVDMVGTAVRPAPKRRRLLRGNEIPIEPPLH